MMIGELCFFLFEVFCSILKVLSFFSSGYFFPVQFELAYSLDNFSLNTDTEIIDYIKNRLSDIDLTEYRLVPYLSDYFSIIPRVEQLNATTIEASTLFVSATSIPTTISSSGSWKLIPNNLLQIVFIFFIPVWCWLI